MAGLFHASHVMCPPTRTETILPFLSQFSISKHTSRLLLSSTSREIFKVIEILLIICPISKDLSNYTRIISSIFYLTYI